MRNKRIFQMTIDAMFIAIIIILTFFWGFIPGPLASLTIVMIPVIVGAYVGGWTRGLLYGLAFGIASWIKALTSPMSVLDPFFQNPLISILPRVAFGLITGFTMSGIKRITNIKIRVPVIVVASFALTMVHSALTLVTLGLVSGKEIADTVEGVTNYWITMGVILGTTSLIESAISAGVSPALTSAIDIYLKRTNKN